METQLISSSAPPRARLAVLGAVLTVFTLAAVACSSADQGAQPAPSPAPAAAPSEPAPEPTPTSTAAPEGPTRIDLPNETNYGYVVAFEELPPATRAGVDAIEAEAIARGMTTTRLIVDWSELEPSPGMYDLSELQERLDDADRRGLRAFVTLSTLDSEGFTIPTDLVIDDVTLADGMSPDDPVIVERFEALLDEVVSVLLDHDVFLFAVANEPRAWLDDNPSETDAVVAFLEAGLAHTKLLAPELPVGVTMIGARFGEPFVDSIVAASDVAVFNLACLDEILATAPPADAESAYADLVAAAGDREIVLQEFGCPSGVPGGSEAYQQEYLASMFEAFEANPLVRSVFIFQLVDWSDELATSFSEPLIAEGLPELGQNYFSWLSTTGLIDYDRGEARPALGTFLDAVSRSAGNPIPEPVPDPAPAAPDAVGLDRLSPGTHLAVNWFSPAQPGTEGVLVAALEEAEAAGSDINRVLLDWTEIETQEGEYTLDELEEQLADMTASGIQPMATISFLGGADQFIPAYLGPWDDTEEIAARYGDLLEVVVPILTEHDVWALSIVNEPEAGFGADFFRAEDFLRFTELAVAKAHSLDPELPVTATLGTAEILDGHAYVPDLMDELDLMTVNHYCLDSDFALIDAADMDGRFDTLLDAAGDKPLVFQEFGCPASEILGSSVEFQAEWFEAAFRRIALEPQIRAAYVFELLDWSPELVEDLYSELVAIPGLGERLNQWFLTTGLFAYEDTTARPAWDVFIEAVRATAD